MTGRKRIWLRWWFELLGTLLLLLPLLALAAAGTYFLWQAGWLLGWIVGTLGIALFVWAGSALRRRQRRVPGKPEEPVTPASSTWAAREEAAWTEVQQLSQRTGTEVLEHRDLMLAVAQRTIESVARIYHPEQEKPVLEFTLPEILLLVERLSARLRRILLEQVPLSHRLKARILLKAWDFRPLLAAGLEHGRHAYTLLRVARVVNPMNALLAEVRDHFMDDLLENAQANARRLIVRYWIEEVGRAAIELYSGQLRIDAETLFDAAANETADNAATPGEPPGNIRLLVAGRLKAGKSTLINGLLGELGAATDVLPLTDGYFSYELQREDGISAYLIDSPGLEEDGDIEELTERAFRCDLLLWVAPAHRADRALDREALKRVRDHFAERPERRMPPLLVVASHIDRLTPVREWEPPYDVDTPAATKELSIRDAIESIANDLDVPIENIVPMRLDSERPYNIELLWLKIEAVLPAAQGARWLRILRDATGKTTWRQTLKQLGAAGRAVGRIIGR